MPDLHANMDEKRLNWLDSLKIEGGRRQKLEVIFDFCSKLPADFFRVPEGVKVEISVVGEAQDLREGPCQTEKWYQEYRKDFGLDEFEASLQRMQKKEEIKQNARIETHDESLRFAQEMEDLKTEGKKQRKALSGPSYGRGRIDMGKSEGGPDLFDSRYF